MIKLSLVPGWRTVLKKSASLWCMRLAILITLVLPESLFNFAQWDTDPRIWGWIAVAMWIAGEWLRIADQGGLDDA